MNEKILITGILIVFMLITISYATAVNTSTSVQNKESPLWGVRTKRAISEKISNIIENIKTKFLGERIFFLPFRGISQNIFYRYSPDEWDTKNVVCIKVHSSLLGKVEACTDAGPTCEHTVCWGCS